MTVRGETLASLAAFRREMPSFRILAIAFVTPGAVRRLVFFVAGAFAVFHLGLVFLSLMRSPSVRASLTPYF